MNWNEGLYRKETGKLDRKRDPFIHLLVCSFIHSFIHPLKGTEAVKQNPYGNPALFQMPSLMSVAAEIHGCAQEPALIESDYNTTHTQRKKGQPLEA